MKLDLSRKISQTLASKKHWQRDVRSTVSGKMRRLRVEFKFIEGIRDEDHQCVTYEEPFRNVAEL